MLWSILIPCAEFKLINECQAGVVAGCTIQKYICLTNISQKINKPYPIPMEKLLNIKIKLSILIFLKVYTGMTTVPYSKFDFKGELLTTNQSNCRHFYNAFTFILDSTEFSLLNPYSFWLTMVLVEGSGLHMSSLMPVLWVAVWKNNNKYTTTFFQLISDLGTQSYLGTFSELYELIYAQA